MSSNGIFLYVFMVLCFIGSIIFQLIPNTSSILYMNGDHAICNTCTNKAEWVWILVTGIIVLLPNIWKMFKKSSSKYYPRHNKRRVFLVFLVVNLVWFLLPVMRSLHEVKTSDEFLYLIGAKTAWPALWNLAFIIFQLKRTSEILDASHEDMKYLHIWAGQAIMIWLVLHTTLISLVYALRSNSFETWLSTMIPYETLYSEGVVNFVGWIAFISFLSLWVTSFPCFRKRYYEQFQWLHLLLSFMFILFSNLHDYNVLHFIQPGFAAWIADYFVRKYSVLTTRIYKSQKEEFQDRESNISFVAPLDSNSGIVGLTFDIPKTWKLPIRPGMFIVVKDLSISPLQSHPFSICSINEETMTFTVYIKALGDWTTKFVRKVRKLSATETMKQRVTEEAFAENGHQRVDHHDFQLEVEGPYGSGMLNGMNSSNRCLFIAGGVGITGISELVIQRHKRYRKQTLVWMVRNIEEMNFLAHEILHHLDRDHCTTNVKIFVTTASHHTEPPPVSSMTGRKQASNFSSTYEPKSLLFLSGMTANTAGILGIALSFLVARMICCYKQAPISFYGGDDYGSPLQECSIFSHSTTCEKCSLDTFRSEGTSTSLPCCTVAVCFFGFRSLPVISTLIISPIIVLSIAQIVARIRQSYRRVKNKYLYTYKRPGGCENEMARCENDKKVYNTHDRSPDQSHHEQDLGEFYPITVEFRRPLLSEVFQEFCDEDNASGIEEEIAVTVCGPPSLVTSVENEVKTCNRQGFKLFQTDHFL